MFGSKRREVRRCEWEIRLPKPGSAPVSWQWADKVTHPSLWKWKSFPYTNPMARNELRPIVKLRSTAGSGYTNVTRKNRRNDPDRMTLRKYDPVVRRHV